MNDSNKKILCLFCLSVLPLSPLLLFILTMSFLKSVETHSLPLSSFCLQLSNLAFHQFMHTLCTYVWSMPDISSSTKLQLTYSNF